MTIKPLADRVLIKPTTTKEKTQDGTITSDSVKEEPLENEAFAVDKDTKDKEMVLKVRDRVLYGRYTDVEIETEDEKPMIMKQNDVLATPQSTQSYPSRKSSKQADTITAKEIKFNIEAYDLLKHGVDQLLDAVKVTLGLKSRSMIISRNYGTPHITRGGVTVVEEIELENESENMGAQFTREVASRTNEDAGDGTTTITVLVQSIINVGLRNIISGANPVEIKHGVDKAVRAVVESIRKRAKEVGDDLEQIAHVAVISASGDKEVGQLIAQAIGKVKKEDVITVEEAKGIDTTADIVEGMQFDNGYMSPYLVTDMEKMECCMEKPYILFHEGKLSIIRGLLPLLEKMLQQGRSLLIIAEDIRSEALTIFILSRLRVGLKICGVRTPGFGNRRKEMLRDMAILTGGTVISKDTGLVPENTTIDMLGSAETVTAVKSKTTIINGDGDKETITDRTNQIRYQIGNTKSDYNREKPQERLAELSDGVAILYTGIDSEVETKEKKDHVEDALGATYTAVEEGTVPDGGTAYVRAISSVKKLKDDIDGERVGIEIVKRAVEEPLRQVVANAVREGAVVIQRIRDGKGAFGYNARTNNFEGLMKHGVIDPAKVVHVVLENVASIVGTFLTTECVIAGIKEGKLDPAAMAGADGMGRMI